MIILFRTHRDVRFHHGQLTAHGAVNHLYEDLAAGPKLDEECDWIPLALFEIVLGGPDLHLHSVIHNSLVIIKRGRKQVNLNLM